MVKAIRFHKTGGPDVMQWEDVEVGAPGPGQVRLKATAIGLNYLDTYHRTGLYPLPLPSGIGMEGAGVITALGEGVSGFAVGDRVAYASILGSYAEERLAPADKLVKLPDSVSDNVAAAIMLKGMTAEYLLLRTFKVKPGDTILWHAAAGGVGLIACQWAKHLGATVIGTVGSDEKAELAKAHGCDHVINYSTENFVERVKEITGGKGVPVVYDSVGKSTWPASLDCLQPLGMMVSFGNASGPIPPVEAGMLSAKGSLFFTRPTLMTYVARRDWLEASAAALFDVVGKGIVKIEINQTYALKDAVQAHIDLEARKTTGSTILLP
ncbi:quinone oxidoreductase [Ferrovibrio sp.]|uniref:quinone oxidoreductase family protein n=1 Tax=Ferrovibrio sp. TaxID=1917215 RepID=UPI001B59F96F|nr:quinone oxidoreductase [Ferrovibrio sp.]MBP7063105.1 quinone oxidoreductase [Ferrovibrio sp.]